MLSNYTIIREITVPKVRVTSPNIYVRPVNIAIGRPGRTGSQRNSVLIVLYRLLGRIEYIVCLDDTNLK